MAHKQVAFRGSSLADLRQFPEPAKREVGFQIDKIQHGQDPDDWKPMDTIGAGIREIRVKDASGIYRVLYVAKFIDIVYVLHCFKKTSQTTSQRDKDVAAKRYKELLKELKL